MASLVGQTVSHYRILEHVGGGGMGVVYKALDTRLDRIVALKFLPPAVAEDPDAKARFIREAHAASALQHDNICTVHDIDETREGEYAGQLFIVMEYYVGETLKKRLQRGPLPLPDALSTAAQIARGLVKAHGQGIVHRDIKPANIFITADGGVKILDFGLAKLGGQPGLTQSGTTAGTIAYMSPEQLTGASVGSRTDQWSLGVVLYEMLCGRMPFVADHDAALGYQILNLDPTPLRDILPEAPEAVSRIISKTLCKDPSSRYSDTSDFLAELRALLKDTESRRQATVPPPLPKGKRRVPRKLIIGVAALASLGMVALAFLLFVSPARRASERAAGSTPRIAVLYLENMSTSAEEDFFAAGMTEDIITDLSRIEGLLVLSRHEVLPYRGKSVGIRTIGQELDVDYVLEGSVRRYGQDLRVSVQLIRASDGVHVWSERYDRAMTQVFQTQSEIASAVASALEVTLSPREVQSLRKEPTRNLQAYDYYLKGREALDARSAEDNRKAEEFLRQAVTLDTGYALAHAGLAAVYVQRLDWGFSFERRWLEEAKILLDRAYRLDSTDAFVLGRMGSYYRLTNNVDECLRWHERAVRQQPSDYEVHYLLGSAATMMGRLDVARRELEKTVSLRPSYPETYRFLADLEFNAGKREATLEYARKAVELSDSAPHVLQHISSLYMRLGEFGEAEALVRKAAELRPGTPSFVGYLGQVQLRRGNVQEAIENLRRAAEEMRSPYYFNDLGWAYRLAGKEMLASEAFRNALRLAREQDKQTDPPDVSLRYAVLENECILGIAQEVEQRLRQAEEMPMVSENPMCDRFWAKASVHAACGNVPAAIDDIRRILGTGIYSPSYVLSSPEFTPLRNDPRFKTLERK